MMPRRASLKEACRGCGVPFCIHAPCTPPLIHDVQPEKADLDARRRLNDSGGAGAWLCAGVGGRVVGSAFVASNDAQVNDFATVLEGGSLRDAHAADDCAGARSMWRVPALALTIPGAVALLAWLGMAAAREPESAISRPPTAACFSDELQARGASVCLGTS